ncbi:DUF6491 family protein [Thalassotalea mangrovi]|uniref:Uncharacterized protein n=1 Tax=Thalassotalea mangrovi TaxID=2572245 RepID=A0A4U1B9A0_9GAMM|nr:DUF6491 family protein [Thalassotalea mangrovi]TKB47145.1 hypothetical protein E8M12_02475 [Thalassotalea mangrovi]
MMHISLNSWLRISSIPLLLMIFGCGSNGTGTAEQKPVDPRQGKEVSQVCYASSLDRWSTLDNERKALLIYPRANKAYKLTLSGTCDPQWAFTRIATVQRMGSSCLSRGDKIVTDMSGGMADSCIITRIHEWHPEKTSDNSDVKDGDTQATDNDENSEEKDKLQQD